MKRLVFLVLLAILLHGCERKVRVKLKVRSADAGQVPERVPQQVSRTSTSSP